VLGADGGGADSGRDMDEGQASCDQGGFRSACLMRRGGLTGALPRSGRIQRRCWLTSGKRLARQLEHPDAQVLQERNLVRCSRLGLAWGDGVWLEGCPQVKGCVPTFVLAG
jgi:hypothetical protein